MRGRETRSQRGGSGARHPLRRVELCLSSQHCPAVALHHRTRTHPTVHRPRPHLRQPAREVPPPTASSPLPSSPLPPSPDLRTRDSPGMVHSRGDIEGPTHCRTLAPPDYLYPLLSQPERRKLSVRLPPSVDRGDTDAISIPRPPRTCAPVPPRRIVLSLRTIQRLPLPWCPATVDSPSPRPSYSVCHSESSDARDRS